jgi:hypothetical protein
MSVDGCVSALCLLNIRVVNGFVVVLVHVCLSSELMQDGDARVLESWLG